MAFDKKNGGASSSGGGRFIKEPRAFDGLNEERAATWLSRMNRLKRSAKINDEEMLLIVEENLIDKAESWWNVEGSKAENWEKFESLFKNQYLSDLEDRWWSAIYALKQGDEYRSVDEVAIRMEELFNLLGNKDQGLLVRTFLNAINPNIAYEIEKESKPATFAIAKERARQVEKSQLKYGVARQDANEVVYKVKSQEPVMDKHDFPDSKSEASTMSSVMSLVDKLEKLSINLVALQDAVANNSRNSSYGAPHRRSNSGHQVMGGIVCYSCGEPGHKKYECTNEVSNESKAPPTTGSNSLPLGANNGKDSGKANEYQQ
ncbi:hypothetical protein G6F42_011801 [Rhizopus arrhizus]|jgi:hypothetical protein|nr:hypothetical protein G6F42_011801 [Rhizopus arrhizus]